jgi:hypothetical protein
MYLSIADERMPAQLVTNRLITNSGPIVRSTRQRGKNSRKCVSPTTSRDIAYLPTYIIVPTLTYYHERLFPHHSTNSGLNYLPKPYHILNTVSCKFISIKSGRRIGPGTSTESCIRGASALINVMSTYLYSVRPSAESKMTGSPPSKITETGSPGTELNCLTMPEAL